MKWLLPQLIFIAAIGTVFYVVYRVGHRLDDAAEQVAAVRQTQAERAVIGDEILKNLDMIRKSCLREKSK